MTDWPVKTLGDIATIATGKIDVNAATENGAYPFFTCSRDVYRIDDAPFEGKAILVAGNGDLNVKYYEGRFNAYQRTYFLFSRDETKSYPRYLFWFLENHLDVLRSGASGSTIKYIRLGDLSEASIAVPPLEEQKRIVALLDAATARVTELTACYEQARTHANNLFTSALRDALESNPDWPVKTLGGVCVIDWGNTNLTKKSYVEGGKYLAVSAAGPDGRIDHAEHKAFTPVLSAIGARCGRMFLPSEDFTAIKNTITLTPKNEFANGEFIFYLLEYSSLPIRGAAQPFMAKGDIEKFEILVPPLEEQKRIVARLDSMRAKISEMVAAYDAKLSAAKNLRQSILEAAFAGDL